MPITFHKLLYCWKRQLTIIHDVTLYFLLVESIYIKKSIEAAMFVRFCVREVVAIHHS